MHACNDDYVYRDVTFLTWFPINYQNSPPFLSECNEIKMPGNINGIIMTVGSQFDLHENVYYTLFMLAYHEYRKRRLLIWNFYYIHTQSCMRQSTTVSIQCMHHLYTFVNIELYIVSLNLDEN